MSQALRKSTVIYPNFRTPVTGAFYTEAQPTNYRLWIFSALTVTAVHAGGLALLMG